MRERPGLHREQRGRRVGWREGRAVQRDVRQEVRRLVLELQRPGHVQRLAADCGDADRAGDRGGSRRRRCSDRELDAPRAAGADHEVTREDGELQRLGVALRNDADRELQTAGRHVANGDRPRRVPARPRPDAEAERCRVGRHLADRGCAEPQRSSPDCERRRSSLLGVAGEQAAERRRVERGAHLGELRRGARDRRGRAARAVERCRRAPSRRAQFRAQPSRARHPARPHPASCCRRRRDPATRSW